MAERSTPARSEPPENLPKTRRSRAFGPKATGKYRTSSSAGESGSCRPSGRDATDRISDLTLGEPIQQEGMLSDLRSRASGVYDLALTTILSTLCRPRSCDRRPFRITTVTSKKRSKSSQIAHGGEVS